MILNKQFYEPTSGNTVQAKIGNNHVFDYKRVGPYLHDFFYHSLPQKRTSAVKWKQFQICEYTHPKTVWFLIKFDNFSKSSGLCFGCNLVLLERQDAYVCWLDSGKNGEGTPSPGIAKGKFGSWRFTRDKS